MTSSPRAQKRARTLVARALPLVVPALLAAAPRLASAQPQPAVEARERGRAALAAGDVAKACLELEGALGAVPQGDPTRDEFLFELAECHAKQGKNLLAASEFDQIAQGAGPKAADAKVRADAIRNPPPPTPPTPPTPPATEPPKGAEPPKDGEKKDDEKKDGDKKDDEKKRSFRLSDFMDTRLTWVFGDDDVLHQTGQAFPLSPDSSIGDRRQYRLFFDNLNSRFAGRENLTHLVLYKKMPSFLKNLDTEASMVLRFDIGALARNTNNVNQALYDAGSYIRLFYHTDKKPEGTEGVGLTLYVLDTDRMRLGWLYDISWGGTNPFINQSIFPRIQGASPGLKLSYDHKVFNVWAGAKTAQIIQVEETLTPGTSEVEQIRVGQTNFGVLGGVGANFGEYVSLDVGGGFFQQGKFDLPDVEGKPVWTGGVSARLHAHHPEAKAAQSIDFLLYRNDPMKQQVFFRPEKYTPGKTTWAASAEFTSLFQHLKDFDVAGATAVQPAIAGALQALIKSGYFRGSLTGIYRDLPFVVRNQPGFIPFQTLPKDSQTQSELFFAAAVDYHIPAIHLTPALGAGLQFPASFKTASIDASNAPIERNVVVREQGNIAILPINRQPVPIIQARFSLRLDISDFIGAMAWVQYTRDNNGTFVERNPDEGTVALRTFVSPDFFGFGTSVQARF